MHVLLSVSVLHEHMCLRELTDYQIISLIMMTIIMTLAVAEALNPNKPNQTNNYHYNKFNYNKLIYSPIYCLLSLPVSSNDGELISCEPQKQVSNIVHTSPLARRCSFWLGIHFNNIGLQND